MSVEIKLHDIADLVSWLETQGKAGEKAASYTIKDIKSRAPSWIAAEVSSEYNIKKSEITPARNEESKNKKAVSINTSGETLETVKIVYRGRTLTPIHFSMTPYKRPKRKKEYIISQEVIKGNRKEIKGKTNWSKPFLAPVEAGSDKYIVFQRKGRRRTKMYSVHSLSVPQMIGNEQVMNKIDARMAEETTKRLLYHFKRFSQR